MGAKGGMRGREVDEMHEEVSALQLETGKAEMEDNRLTECSWPCFWGCSRHIHYFLLPH